MAINRESKTENYLTLPLSKSTYIFKNETWGPIMNREIENMSSIALLYSKTPNSSTLTSDGLQLVRNFTVHITQKRFPLESSSYQYRTLPKLSTQKGIPCLTIKPSNHKTNLPVGKR